MVFSINDVPGPSSNTGLSILYPVGGGDLHFFIAAKRFIKLTPVDIEDFSAFDFSFGFSDLGVLCCDWAGEFHGYVNGWAMSSAGSLARGGASGAVCGAEPLGAAGPVLAGPELAGPELAGPTVLGGGALCDLSCLVRRLEAGAT